MIKKNFLVSCGSAKGLRPNNEDAFAFEKNIFGQLFAVICDGIGSQLHSEIVSTNTTTSLAHLFLQKRKIKNPKRFFSKALKNTQKIINKKINEVRKNARIGTTLISCFIDEGKVTVFNIGDSRLFHFDSNEKKWKQISNDHNYLNLINDKFDRLIMEKKKANASEHEIELLEINREEIIQRNEDNILALTKSFESNEKTYQNYDTFDIKIKKNDIIVLCCDGLYNWIELSKINEIIDKETDFSKVADKLIELALKNGSNDNITTIVIKEI